MAKITRIRRRHFLVGTGAVLAGARMPGRRSQQALAAAVRSKPGAAPGYIISGRGEHSSNPYFHPQGGPSDKQALTPPEAHGKGVDEDDQGRNQ
jgi:hypothetical protein